MYFKISDLFIVDTTSILKLVFRTAYCSWLHGHVSGCVGACMIAAFPFFSVVSIVIFIFVVVVVIATVALRLLFCVCGYCCC